ncbi:MAG: hypothetical protein V1772_02645, partial [Chloroflexota bacterium]
QVGVAELRAVALGEAVDLTADQPWVLALDGEREITLQPGDALRLKWRGDGPWIVSAARVMGELAARGMFEHLAKGEDEP